MAETTPTHDAVRRLAERTDLETLIRRLAKAGSLNHLSLSADTENGKSFVAIFRDSIGFAPYRYMVGADPVETMKLALASVLVLHKEPAKSRHDDDLI